jgi:hypothetical protein
MTTSRMFKVFALASAVLLAPRALAQAPTEPGPFHHDFLITSQFVAAPLDAANLDPASPGWSGLWAAAPATAVNLWWKIVSTVNAAVYSSTSGVRVLSVQSVNDGTAIAFKMVIGDPSQSDTIADVPLFHDSLALTIPFGVEDSSFFAGCDAGPAQIEMIHMGNPCDGLAGLQCCPAGHLFWRADKGTPDPAGGPHTVPGLSESELLSSASPGSIHELAETDAGVAVTWAGYDAAARTWTVVVVRPLVSPPPLPPPDGATIICQEGIVGIAPLTPAAVCTPIGNLPALSRRGAAAPYQIVFANWDGGQAERNGMKFIGVWGDLVIE